MRSAVAENPARTLHRSVCYRRDVIGDGILTLRGSGLVLARILDGCRLVCNCDLYLDAMTFVYELDAYSLEIHRICRYELPTSRLSKVIV